MIGFIQKLLQLALIVGIVYLLINPAILPSQFQPIGYRAQRIMIGETVSWASFSSTWQGRWEWLTRVVPPLAQLGKGFIAEPPTITADSIMDFFHSTFFAQPAQKWESIKQQVK